jgi:hypothetical protein
MCPRGVTGRHVVKNCGEDRTDAKYNANLGNNYIHKLNNPIESKNDEVIPPLPHTP